MKHISKQMPNYARASMMNINNAKKRSSGVDISRRYDDEINGSGNAEDISLSMHDEGIEARYYEFPPDDTSYFLMASRCFASIIMTYMNFGEHL